jgi:hypothetical protein
MNFLAAVVALIIIAAVYKFVLNFVKIRRLRAYRASYDAYWKRTEDHLENWDFVRQLPAIKGLLTDAGVEDRYLHRSQLIGHGHIERFQISVMNNMIKRDRDIPSSSMEMFYEAEGVFEARRRESYDFFYWVDVILHLPSRMMLYLGMPSGSIWSRAVNVVGWVIGVVGFITSLPDFVDFQRFVSTYLAGAWRFVAARMSGGV